MALSVYPNSVPSFVTHRNLLDDVDAEDINYIQREVSAIANALGPNPHLYTDVSLVQASVTGGSSGTITDGDWNTGGWQYFDPKAQPISYGNVANRLDALQQGLNTSVFSLQTGRMTLGSNTGDFAGLPDIVNFPTPTTQDDPAAMYTGTGVYLRKSGFWSFEGYAYWEFTFGAANAGTYQAVIMHDRVWYDAMDRKEIDSSSSYSPACNPRLSGYFPRGTLIELGISQSSPIPQSVRVSRLSGHLIREY